MALLIGVDEAGYGPNFGPLVVAATVWEIADEQADGSRQTAVRKRAQHSDASSLPAARCPLPATPPDLYKLLRRAVSRTPRGKRVAVADSKALYNPAIGLATLERGVLAALHTTPRLCRANSPSPVRGGGGTASRNGQVHGVAAQRSANGDRPHPSPLPEGEGTRLSWLSLVETLSADANERQRELPWHDGFDCDVPCATQRDDVESASGLLAGAMDSVGVRLRSIRARLVFPCEFNELVEQYGNKASALSEVTLRLVREVVDRIQDSGVRGQGMNVPSLTPDPRPLTPLVVCDKHGGRNFYAALVQQHFPETWVEVLHESRAASWYRTTWNDAPLDFCFRVEGEEFLPAALASMTAKYVRELAMRAFNEFWCARIPDLRPTAGYPTDSRRFRKAIAPEQRRLGIEDRLLWRER